MKNVSIFIVALLAFFSNLFSQNEKNDKNDKNEKKNFSIKLGTSDINFFSEKNPLEGFFSSDRNSIGPSSGIELGYNINDHVGLYLDGTIGLVKNYRWKVGNSQFVKLSNGVKIHALPNNKIDPYLRLGGGYHRSNAYIENDLKISDKQLFRTSKVNFPLVDGGVGVNLWMHPNLGINVNSTYNHVFSKQSSNYLDFWKHDLGLVFRFKNFLNGNKISYEDNEKDQKSSSDDEKDLKQNNSKKEDSKNSNKSEDKSTNDGKLDLTKKHLITNLNNDLLYGLKFNNKNKSNSDTTKSSSIPNQQKPEKSNEKPSIKENKEKDKPLNNTTTKTKNKNTVNTNSSVNKNVKNKTKKHKKNKTEKRGKNNKKSNKNRSKNNRNNRGKHSNKRPNKKRSNTNKNRKSFSRKVSYKDEYNIISYPCHIFKIWKKFLPIKKSFF
ncbi:outer membrane beta-barrel protein [Blattabacterium cuenoti]|uniref:outer membrane beta-barrel protein n=1 Tax=Blattabacterium cuenoti TaxID=1653831 RepID=UPI00163BA7D3|nr:outer membrane beta-barrel protein [Blattabacterium cuenoti]